MIFRPTALERAFELARSGSCIDVIAIRKALKAEGFSDSQLSGVTLTRQLRDLCAVARGGTPESAPKRQAASP